MGSPGLPPELAPLAAALQASAGLATAPEPPRYPRVGERKVPGKCRVVGCTADLRRQTPSNVKNRLCQAHWSAPVLVFHGEENRFCSKCTRLRPLADFDGDKRTCRKCLQSHTARRRAREAGAGFDGPRMRVTDRGGERSTSASEEDALPQFHGPPPPFEGVSPVPTTPSVGPQLAQVLAAAMAEAAKRVAANNMQLSADGAGGSGSMPPQPAAPPAAPSLGAVPSPATLRRLAAAIKVEKLNMELAQARQELELAQLEESLGSLQGGVGIPAQLLETIQSLIRGPNS